MYLLHIPAIGDYSTNFPCLFCGSKIDFLYCAFVRHITQDALTDLTAQPSLLTMSEKGDFFAHKVDAVEYNSNLAVASCLSSSNSVHVHVGA